MPQIANSRVLDIGFGTGQTTLRVPLMLFVDLAEGFANIARSLPSGGRIAFSCPGMGRDAADATDFVFATGPVRCNLDGVDPRTIGRLRDAVRAGLQEFESPEGIIFRRSDRLVTATRC